MAKKAKSRTVMVTLELNTNVPLTRLKSAVMWQETLDSGDDRTVFIEGECQVRQVSVSVAQPVKPTEKK